MFYIVEQEDKLQNLQNLIKLGVYVDVISSNDYYHPKLTSTVAVYVRLIDSHHGFIIPINHDEGINVSKDRIYELLLSASKLYTLDKKALLYHFNLQDAIDLSLLYSMTKYERLEKGILRIKRASGSSAEQPVTAPINALFANKWQVPEKR